MVAGCQRISIKGGVIMTTNAAAASKISYMMPTRSRFSKLGRWLRAAAFGTCTLALAGCETSSGMFGGDASTPGAQALVPVQATTAPPTRLALAPVIGMPPGVDKQLMAQMTSAIERQRVTIVKNPSERVDYTLRGYVVASKEKTGTKVSYIWDVMNQTGARVHRITGEELVAGAAGKDAWASVSPAIVQTVADKTSSAFVTWLATVPPPAATATPTAQPTGSNGAMASGGANNLVQQASVTSAVPVNTLAAVGGRLMVASPKVTGAPGDGNAALSTAMRRELSVKGVEITEASVGTYKVLADVKLKSKTDGNEAISIDWIVNDPQGGRIATVTQNNDVPKGHLSGEWGQNADDAAKGASIQIKQVIADHSAGKAIKSSQTANAQ
jgi:hypothetical protein